MADNLTVDSRATEAATKESAPKTDPAQLELERLRSIAKSRHNKNLSDDVLKAIISRRKARMAHDGRLKETKQSFETSQGKEKVGAKSADPQTQAKKTVGTRETKSVQSKVTEEEANTIRSGRDAKLPPTLAKATTREQAAEMLEKMVGLLVSEEGESFDLEAYAKTLKSKPPTQPKQAAKPNAQKLPTQKQAGQKQVAQKSSGQQAPKLASTSAGLRGPGSQTGPGQGTTRGPGTQAPPQPTRMPPDTSGVRLPTAPTQSGANLSFRTGGGMTGVANTGVSAEGLFNAGGGLIGTSDFNGMLFNWEGFFSLFFIRSQEAMQEWRKMMKELRRLEGEAALQGMKAQKALLSMRQLFKKQQAGRNLFQALQNVPRAIVQAEVENTCGIKQRYHMASLRNSLKRPFSGMKSEELKKLGINPPWLTKSQRAKLESTYPEVFKEYTKALEGVRESRLGLVGQMGLQYESLFAIDKQIAELDKPDATPDQKAQLKQLEAAKKELQAEMQADIRTLESRVGEWKQNPYYMALMAQQRELLQHIANQAHNEGKGLEKGEKKDEIRAEERVLLSQLRVLDHVMSRGEKRTPDHIKGYKNVVDAAAQHLPKAGKNREAVEADLEQRKRLTGDGVPMDTLLGNEKGASKLERLRSDANAGNAVNKERQKHGYDLAKDQMINAATEAVEAVAADASFKRAIDSAVQSAISFSIQQRGETTAEMQQHLGKIQGLINQLAQLIAMSRSR